MLRYTFIVALWGLLPLAAGAQAVITLSACGVSYADPQAGGSPGGGQDTLRYTEYFAEAALRNFQVDINAFGGAQIDRARVFALLPDGSRKPLGALAFGNCPSCVTGFAFLHNEVLLVEGVSTVAEMDLWLQSESQPPFQMPGNLQTLVGVGRISGRIPFCAIGWQVDYTVTSNPNSTSTEFATHILCPQLVTACPLTRSATLDCEQGNILLSADIPAACLPPGATIQWSDNQGWASDGLQASRPISGHLGWYYISISDDCCTLLDSVFVDNPPFAAAGPDQQVCAGTDVTLVGSGGSGHFWVGPDGATLNDSLLLFPAAQPGQSGLYSLHAFDANGCEDTDTLRLLVQAVAAPVLSFNTPCLGDTLSFSLANAADYASAQWVSPQGAVLTPPQVPDFQTEDIGTYTLNLADALGCTATLPILVGANEPPLLNISFEDTCDSTRARLSPEVYDYVWDTGLTGPVIGTATGGTFSVTVTDAVGCASVLSVVVPAPTGPAVAVDIQQPLCPGENGRIVLIPESEDRPMIFSIDGGQSYTANPAFQQVPPGEYAIIVEDALGCVQTLEANILAPDTLGVSLNMGNMEVRPGTPISLQGSTVGNVSTYQWLPAEIDTGTPSTDFTAQFNVDVRLIVADDKGCRTSSSLQITVVLGDVYIPTAFSPNDDGINDRFTFYSDGGSGEVIERLHIFDRWGGLVFSRSEFPLNANALGWDGYWRGKFAPEGTFAYFGIVRFGNGIRKTYQGDITLTR